MCMKGKAIEEFQKVSRYRSLNLSLMQATDVLALRTFIPDEVYDAWMSRYNKPDLTEVEFRMYRPTSSSKADTALMSVVEESSSTASGNSIFVGYSETNSASHSETICCSKLMELVQMSKRKNPEIYLRFMTIKPSVISKTSLLSSSRLKTAAKKRKNLALLCDDGIYVELIILYCK